MDFIEGLLYMMWRGIAIGVIISAPMGPVGILCVQRTLEKGRTTGFFTGVGAALSDLFYCLLTGFGLSFIEEFLKANQNIIQLIGSVLLVVFGVYLFKSNPAGRLKKPGTERSSRGKNVLSGFLFTFSNPLIIFLIIGLFARFNFLLPEITFPQYMAGFLFIFAGALLWWWIVSFFVDKVRAHFNLRSMWLVNKIIGVIILIFALVGIVTAISGMASAGTREPLYLNSTRGFGTLGESGGGPLVIENPTCDTIIRFLPLDAAEEFSFSFRGTNLHNASGRTYAASDSGLYSRRVANPGWGIALRGTGGRSLLTVTTSDRRLDDFASPSLHFELTGDSLTASADAYDGFDLYTGPNSYRLIVSGGRLLLQGGNRSYTTVLDAPLPCLAPDSIGFAVLPGGWLEIDNITLDVESERRNPLAPKFSHFGLADVRRSYFSRSTDDKEGEWMIFDRMLDDDELRCGGNYRFALVGDSGGYRLIYLDGASVEASRWEAGQDKAFLTPTPFAEVYDVRWLDPRHSPLVGEIKAQFVSDGMLVLTFADHGGSTVRLRKLSPSL